MDMNFVAAGDAILRWGIDSPQAQQAMHAALTSAPRVAVVASGARPLTLPGEKQATTITPAAEPIWNVETVRAQRPAVVIRSHGRLFPGRVERVARLTEVATVIWRTNSGVYRAQWRLADIVRALNEGKALQEYT